MERIITTEKSKEYIDSFLKYKPHGLLLQHFWAAHSFYHINPEYIKNNRVNMYEYGIVDDTCPDVVETLMDKVILSNEMIQSGQENLLGVNFDQYVNLLVKTAITKLENIDINCIESIISSSNEIFEILFGHLFSFDNNEISSEVLQCTPEIIHLKENLVNTVEIFQNSEYFENKLLHLKNGLFVDNGSTEFGYGVKSVTQLEQIRSTYFEPQSEYYLPGAVQLNLKKIRNLIENSKSFDK
jgi:hypothetical protein